MDLLYLIVLTLTLEIGKVEVGTGSDQGTFQPTQGVVSRQVVLVSISVGESREAIKTATKDFRTAISKVVVIATCYEVSLKAGTVRGVPCP